MRKVAVYPNLIVPLQLELAIGDRRYLFGCSGTLRPGTDVRLLGPASTVVVSRTLARAGSVARTKGPASATGLGIKGRRRKPLPCPRAVRNAMARLATADCELNPHGRSPVLTCSFMPFVGVQIGVGGPTPHRTTRAEPSPAPLERWFVAA